MLKTKSVFQVALAAVLLPVFISSADVTYNDILQSEYSVTGVRADVGTDVILTGSYVTNSTNMGMLYQGPLYPSTGTYYYIVPDINDNEVTGSNYYSVDTTRYSPSLAGNVRVTGTYKYTGSSLNHGVLYEGAISGGGSWTQLDVSDSAAGGTVANTIPHSTMGGLVVGDYDLTAPDSNNAFIYDMAKAAAMQDPWTVLNIDSTANNTSLYGIWQNGIGSTSYTLAGGSTHSGLNQAFLVDYDSFTGAFTHLTFFTDGPAGLTHFEGISGIDGGFSLIGTTTSGAAFATVMVDELTGDFGPATWVPLQVLGSSLTTGNSVIGYTGMGVYSNGGPPQSYIATVPEPSTVAMLALGGIGALAGMRKRLFRKTASQDS